MLRGSLGTEPISSIATPRGHHEHQRVNVVSIKYTAIRVWVLITLALGKTPSQLGRVNGPGDTAALSIISGSHLVWWGPCSRSLAARTFVLGIVCDVTARATLEEAGDIVAASGHDVGWKRGAVQADLNGKGGLGSDVRGIGKRVSGQCV